nr:hypothetical protein [uncultured Helicobacter sp.]
MKALFKLSTNAHHLYCFLTKSSFCGRVSISSIHSMWLFSNIAFAAVNLMIPVLLGFSAVIVAEFLSFLVILYYLTTQRAK